MENPQGITRVILVVLDGLRADAVPLFSLPHLTALAARGTSTFSARTISPSITAAAMTSLFTGVSPQVHGIANDRWGLPRPTRPLTLLPKLLRQHGRATRCFMSALPRPYRGLGRRMASHVGIDATFMGECAADILDVAADSLMNAEAGVTFLHWPDADRAGHARGWNSGEYLAATRTLDAMLGRLVHMTGLLDDPGTVLVAFADHGGGGKRSRDHESDHPLDVTIPIVLAGGQVVTGELAPCTSLLDVPATVAWALGVMPPADYEGRILIEAFAPSGTTRSTTDRPRARPTPVGA